MECILGKRVGKKTRRKEYYEYLVKWKNHVLAVIIGVAGGALAATYRGRWPEWLANGFSLAGTPGVLVEQRFGQEMTELARGLDLDYSALISALALEGFITMKGLAEAAADGSLFTLDPALADQIPARPPSITYAALYNDDAFVAEGVLIG